MVDARLHLLELRTLSATTVIWAQPVMPGFAPWRRSYLAIRVLFLSSSANGWGRGPTNDIRPNHVEQLRQFVDTGPPQEVSDPGHATVAAPGLLHGRTIFLYGHRAEFPDRKCASVKTSPPLFEDCRSWGLGLYQQRDDQQKRREDEKSDRCHCEIERPFS